MAIVLPKFSRRRSSTGLASETQPAVRLSLCNDEATYEVGSSLKASWRISRVPLEEIQSLEVSVLWFSEGKGDEDFHVHHFHRISETQIRRGGISGEQSTKCVLPVTPLSYHGRLINLRWCARLRMYLAGGREIVSEHPFYLVSANMKSPCEAVAAIESVEARSGDTSAAQVASRSISSRQLVANASRR